MDRNILLLGLGNMLLQDEGLGVRALDRLLERFYLPEQVQAIDGGTLGLDLLPLLEDASDLLVLDAIHGNRLPGTLVRLEGDEIPSALALKMSMHQLGLQDLLAVGKLRGSLPERIVLWGMQPASLAIGLDLSYAVTHQLDALIEAAVTELRQWGVQVQRKAPPRG